MFSIQNFDEEKTFSSAVNPTKAKLPNQVTQQWENNSLLTPLFKQAVTLQEKQEDPIDHLLHKLHMQFGSSKNPDLLTETYFQDMLKLQYTLHLDNHGLPDLYPISGLEALLMKDTPDLTPSTISQIAYILRGDLVHHLSHHKEKYSSYFSLPASESEEALETYLKRLQDPKEPLGIAEMHFFSDMLQIPIYIHTSFAEVKNSYGKLVPHTKYRFGRDFFKPILHLYFNPMTHRFSLMVQTSPFAT